MDYKENGKFSNNPFWKGHKMDYYAIIEKARKTGKIDKGTNEVTKAIERGVAKAVFYAADVNPKEIVAHISVIAKEKGILCFEVDSKQKLGIAAGVPVSASSVAIIEPGEADKYISELGMKKESIKEKFEKNFSFVWW